MTRMAFRERFSGRSKRPGQRAAHRDLSAIQWVEREDDHGKLARQEVAGDRLRKAVVPLATLSDWPKQRDEMSDSPGTWERPERIGCQGRDPASSRATRSYVPLLCWSMTATPPVCTGDCDDDHSVTVDELVILVGIALGKENIAACTAGDAKGGDQITVDEILIAVNNALDGCQSGAAPERRAE